MSTLLTPNTQSAGSHTRTAMTAAMPMGEEIGLNAKFGRELEGKTVLEWVPTSEI